VDDESLVSEHESSPPSPAWELVILAAMLVVLLAGAFVELRFGGAP